MMKIILVLTLEPTLLSNIHHFEYFIFYRVNIGMYFSFFFFDSLNFSLLKCSSTHICNFTAFVSVKVTTLKKRKFRKFEMTVRVLLVCTQWSRVQHQAPCPLVLRPRWPSFPSGLREQKGGFVVILVEPRVRLCKYRYLVGILKSEWSKRAGFTMKFTGSWFPSTWAEGSFFLPQHFKI